MHLGDARSQSTVRVSLIATILNEASSLPAWFASIAAQTRQPDEVVIVDAGSTDGSLELLDAQQLADPRLRSFIEPNANVPEGRNRAIAAARGQLIAITDAGTLPDPDWLQSLLEPLERDPDVAVSAGFFAPDGGSPFELILASAITPRLPEIDPDRFLPSSRSVAVRREWWERSGGYPEWLRAGEDLVFAMRLKDAGARFAFAPSAVVRWRPRPSLLAYFKQYKHYARGDGHAHLWPKRHLARYSAYTVGVALTLSARQRRVPRALLVAGFAAYMKKFLWRVLDQRPVATRRGMVGALAMTPIIVVTGDVAKMIGYPQGLWERWHAGGPEALQEAGIGSHRAATRRRRAR